MDSPELSVNAAGGQQMQAEHSALRKEFI